MLTLHHAPRSRSSSVITWLGELGAPDRQPDMPGTDDSAADPPVSSPSGWMPEVRPDPRTGVQVPGAASAGPHPRL